MALSIERAQLISVVLEALFYGLFLVTFFPCLKALLWRDDSGFSSLQSIPWTMLIFCLIFATFATLDLFFQFYRALEAFTSSSDAFTVFTNISDWTNVVQVIEIVSFCSLLS